MLCIRSATEMQNRLSMANLISSIIIINYHYNAKNTNAIRMTVQSAICNSIRHRYKDRKRMFPQKAYRSPRRDFRFLQVQPFQQLVVIKCILFHFKWRKNLKKEYHLVWCGKWNVVLLLIFISPDGENVKKVEYFMSRTVENIVLKFGIPTSNQTFMVLEKFTLKLLLNFIHSNPKRTACVSSPSVKEQSLCYEI